MARLIDRLPKIRGRYSEASDLSKVTWFRVGGPAEVLFKPEDLDDLCHFLANKPSDVPINIIGVGSNLLVRDGGIPGVVIRLGRKFSNLVIDGEQIDVGAAMLDRNLALACADAGISGLEFFSGVPGTIGGALKMNAGCYGTEVKDILISALAVAPNGEIHKLTVDDCKFSYRHCDIPEDWLFVAARFKGKRSTPAEVHANIDRLLKQREESQPIKTRTGGSTFANPEGLKAWELIDQAGCRGLQVGGAQVSQMHCNFLNNVDNATATDLETLGETVREKVKASSGIDLRWEIKIVGVDKVASKEEAA